MKLRKVTRDNSNLVSTLVDFKLIDRNEAYPNSNLMNPQLFLEDTLRFIDEGRLEQYVFSMPEEDVGYAVGKSTPCNSYEILKYFVKPELRGQGRGSTIVQEQINIAKQKGHNFIFAYVYNHNKSSLRVFEKAGFKVQDVGGAYLVIKDLRKPY